MRDQARGTREVNIAMSAIPLAVTWVLHDLSAMTDKRRPVQDPSQTMPRTMATVSDCDASTAIAMASMASNSDVDSGIEKSSGIDDR